MWKAQQLVFQLEHVQCKDILAGKLQLAFIACVQSESFQRLKNQPNLVRLQGDDKGLSLQ